MRLLLMMITPLKFELVGRGRFGHAVIQLAWRSKQNILLLQPMVADGFDGLLTVDRNLPFQQNLQRAGVGVVVVRARTNRLKELRPFVSAILDALGRLTPGQLIEIGE